MTESLIPRLDVDRATLPERYIAAKKALSECSQIDECKGWHDLAAAQASYARQAQDDEMERMAQRIRGRAARRLGELLRAQKATIGLGQGRRTDLIPDGNYVGPPTIEEAGISAKLSSQAQRIAGIPKEEFEAAIESDRPPSINQLAQRGREELSKPRPPGFRAATEALGTLRRFAQFCKSTDASTVAGGLEETERKQAMKLVSEVDSWLDQLIVKLGG